MLFIFLLLFGWINSKSPTNFWKLFWQKLKLTISTETLSEYAHQAMLCYWHQNLTVLIRIKTDTNYFGERKVAPNLIWRENSKRSNLNKVFILCSSISTLHWKYFFLLLGFTKSKCNIDNISSIKESWKCQVKWF